MSQGSLHSVNHGGSSSFGVNLVTTKEENSEVILLPNQAKFYAITK